MVSSVFALLPAEIVRLVLECSARDSSQTAARLLRVSKLVHGWIQPLFYETLIISVSTYRKFVLAKMKAITLHAPCVRNVCITFPTDIHPSAHLPTLFNPSYLHILRTTDLRQDVHEILNASTHLSHLYVDIALDQLASFIPASSYHTTLSLSQTLTHLHCGSWESWLFVGRHIIFLTSLTHLRVDVAYNTGILSSFIPLLTPSAILSRLSHLAIATDSRSSAQELRATANFTRAILRREGMQLVVVSAWYYWDSTSEKVREAFLGAAEEADGAMAGKVCVLGMEGSPDGNRSVKEWEDEVRGKKSIWNKANDILRRGQLSYNEDQREDIALGILERTEFCL